MLPADTSELWVPRIAAGAGGLAKDTFPKPEEDFPVFPTPQKQSSLPCLGVTWPCLGWKKLSRLVLGSVAAAVAALGRGKHHSVMPLSLLIPLRGNTTGQRVTLGCSAVGHLEMLSCWSCCPALLPQRPGDPHFLWTGRNFPSQRLTAAGGSGAGCEGLWWPRRTRSWGSSPTLAAAPGTNLWLLQLLMQRRGMRGIHWADKAGRCPLFLSLSTSHSGEP